MQGVSKVIVIPFIWAIRIYRAVISSHFPSVCKYYPSCSEYAIEALNKHGLKGVLMSIKRILRCHPFAKGGHDPVR